MAINTFLGIMYLGYAETFEAKIVVLLASFSFTFVATIALQKHRFFEVAKSEEFRWIQSELLKELKNVRELKLRTEEIYNDLENYPTVPRNWMTRRRAYPCLLLLMCVNLLFMLALIIKEIVSFIN